MESQETLFKRFIKNECTRQEIEDLLALFADASNEVELRQIILEYLQNDENIDTHQLPYLIEKENLIYSALLPHIQVKRIFRLWPRISAAASLLLCCSVGLYLYLNKQKLQQTTQIAENDIAPGSNQAILKTNGKIIILASAQNGVIAHNGLTLIKKSSDGLVSYSGTLTNTNVIYDTLTIPRKGQHVLVLNDGSKVWLNSASQLRFPEQFTGKERRVELIYGEAYFEVKHDAKMPFRVMRGKQVIEDVGTQFNVNAYPDENASKITLVEGSISVDHKILKPGQQQITSGSNVSIVGTDTEAVTAWKDGDFIFKEEDFKTVMRKIARWYDVEVVYDPSATIDHIPGGWVSRSKPISAVLKMMEETGKVHFKVQGRRITVIK